MQACVREAIKNGSRLALTRVFPTGKILVAAPSAAARNRLRPDAVSNWRAGSITRAQGGVMCHVKPHGMLYNRRRKRHNWQTPSPERYTLATGIDSRRAGRKRADSCRQAIGLTTREEVFADRGYQADGSLCREASQAR